MPLAIGSRLGHYDVTALIGEGGMGQVYQATDTQLNRQVALKILPEAFATDPDRLARFQREAQVLASLNHPGIAAIYGIEEAEGTRALVLELVEGPTLADRIARGPIPLDEALPIAKQIAEALEAAHEQGVIHRDLKPANVKVKDDGTVKVLDFGLAKAFQPDASDPSLSQSPTISLTAAATQMGMVIGTAAYMAPEQAKGKPIDKRADVWAFGAVLYEMLAGKKPFTGDDVSETLARVIDREPDWDALPVDVPPVLGSFLRRCLTKNPKQRVHDIADLRLAMEGAFETTASALAGPSAVPQPRLWQRPAWAGLIALAVAALSSLTVWTVTRPAPQPQPLARFTIPLADESRLPRNPGPALALSPDGQRLVYAGVHEDSQQLYVRSLDQVTAVPLRGTDGAQNVFWSPDGEWVGFQADGLLKRVALAGGAPETLCEAAGLPSGASWGLDNTIVFGNGRGSPLMRVSASGGVPEPLTSLNTDKDETAHLWPQLLSGGSAVLFTVLRGDTSEGNRVAVQSLDAEGHRELLVGTSTRYVPTGHLVFAREGTLWMAPFALGTLEVTGPESPVLEDVRITGGGIGQFSIAGNGSLVYAPRGNILSGDLQSFSQTSNLVWLTRDGTEPTGLPPDAYVNARLSPDAEHVSLMIDGLDNVDVWVSEVDRNTLTRVTTHPASDFMGVWTTDGEEIVFNSTREGGRSLFVRAADGTGAVERLLTIEDATSLGLWGGPIDAERLVFTYTNSSGVHLASITLDGQSSLQPVLDSEENQSLARVSPDGQWIAYQSDETGDREIYVQRFPSGGQRRRVSTAGGVKALWSPDGKAIFYARGNALMIVPVEMEPTFTTGTPSVLFQTDTSLEPGNQGLQDIHPDGRRFLALIPEASAEELVAQSHLVFVQNWFQELTERVPVP